MATVVNTTFSLVSAEQVQPLACLNDFTNAIAMSISEYIWVYLSIFAEQK